jgi:hypothetical protein
MYQKLVVESPILLLKFALTFPDPPLSKENAQMKLSEAILLGSTVVAPKAGSVRFSRENAGCALGMAAIATGCTFGKPLRQIPVKDLRTVNMEEIFGVWLLRSIARPCDCRPPITLRGLHLKQIGAYLSDRRSAALPREMRIKDIIAHLFDHHVMVKKDWTIDRLAAWVERWESTDLRRATPATPANPTSALQSLRADVEDREEWQKTRQAFEAKFEAKTSVRRRRGASVG